MSTDQRDKLLAHLHRGGAWTYWWTTKGKRSWWWQVGEPAEIPPAVVNLYFGVHPTNERRGEHARARIKDIAAINCLFAEFDAKDFDGDPSATLTRSAGKARALAHIESLLIAPSVIVDSGGGYHCYWFLRDTFVIATEADRERIRRLQAAWVMLVGGDQGAKDLARVLRVPGTLNYKYNPPRPVEIIRAEFDRVYSLDALERAAQATKNERPKTNGGRARGNGHRQYAQAALANELEQLARTKEGARNAQLNKSAFALGQFVGAGVLDRGAVETQLANIAQMIGLSEREICATLQSGIEAGMREPHAIPSGGNGHEPLTTDKDVERVPSLAEQVGQYLISEGRICRRKRTQDGSVIVPLCNFTAQITEEVVRNNGAEVECVMTIRGTHADGRLLPVVQVDAAQFASLRWIAAKWGARAIVEAGASAQDHLRAAMQYLSSNVTSRHVFTHTGWREIEGKRVYLTQRGAIGDPTIVVELDKELERYALPTQPHNALEAMRESLRFLDIAPYRVTIPLWAALYLAPLTEIIPLRFMLWVYGATGVFKSALIAVALSHYGDFTQDDLLAWSGTANSLEKYAFLVKDAVLVIDDFAPQTDQTSAQKIEQLAARLVRDIGNHAGRARMNSDLSLRTVYRPRGLVISTGEQLPNGQSLVGRLVTVEVNKGDVNLARLSEAQDNCRVYPDAMAAYILWLGNQWTHLKATLPARWKDLRARARKANQHARLPESLASLYVGLDLGLTFAVTLGALTERDAQALREDGWAALCEIAERQHGLTEEQRPARRFLTVIVELVSQGKAHLNHTDTPESSGDGEMLGWYDAEYLYLLPGASYHIVARYEKDEGRIFGVKENMLRKMLAEEGISVGSDDGHYTARLWLGGQNKRVLKIRSAEVEKISGVSLRKSG